MEALYFSVALATSQIFPFSQEWGESISHLLVPNTTWPLSRTSAQPLLETYRYTEREIMTY